MQYLSVSLILSLSPPLPTLLPLSPSSLRCSLHLVPGLLANVSNDQNLILARCGRGERLKWVWFAHPACSVRGVPCSNQTWHSLSLMQWAAYSVPKPCFYAGQNRIRDLFLWLPSSLSQPHQPRILGGARVHVCACPLSSILMSYFSWTLVYQCNWCQTFRDPNACHATIVRDWFCSRSWEGKTVKLALWHAIGSSENTHKIRWSCLHFHYFLVFRWLRGWLDFVS